ncbi:MAG: acyl-CoA dehydrogenase family protein, partial [Alphaproteobacteria bacterium]
TVAKYLLEFERGGTAYGPGLEASLTKVRAMAQAEPVGGQALIEDRGFKAKLDAAEIEIRAIDATEQRLMSEMSQGQNPGAASSMVKTLGSEVNQRVSELGIEAIAHYGFPHQPEARVPGGNVEPIGPDHAVAAMARYLNTRAHSIYAGSNEIQRNIMAKLVLGL